MTDAQQTYLRNLRSWHKRYHQKGLMGKCPSCRCIVQGMKRAKSPRPAAVISVTDVRNG